MNITNTDNIDDSNPVFIYIMLAIEILNSLISVWTSYKLGHMDCQAQRIKCCCLEITDINIEVSDSSEDSKNKKKIYNQSVGQCG